MMPNTERRMTDADRAEKQILRVDEWRVRWNTYSGPEYDDLRRACNDIVELTADWSNERTENARLRERLEAAEAVIEAIWEANATSIERDSDIVHTRLLKHRALTESEETNG